VIEESLLRAVVADVTVGVLHELDKGVKKVIEEICGPDLGEGRSLTYLPNIDGKVPSWRWPRK